MRVGSELNGEVIGNFSLFFLSTLADLYRFQNPTCGIVLLKGQTQLALGFEKPGAKSAGIVPQSLVLSKSSLTPIQTGSLLLHTL